MILNRGNHEDFAICTVYGFQLECCEKYGDVIFGLFVEIFQQLPLFAVVNKAVIVLHGGLFHTADTTLEELDKIDRLVEFSFRVAILQFYFRFSSLFTKLIHFLPPHQIRVFPAGPARWR